MKRLLVLRHAKAVPAEDAAEDAARALSPRGHGDAARLGTWLLAHDMVPARALCSPARRTRETFEDVSSALGQMPEATFPEVLYLASAANLLACVHKAADGVQSLLVVGHNPGLENFVLHLARKPKSEAEAKRLRAMAEGFPTCALAVFDFDIAHFKQLAVGHGELVAYIRPKDLKG